MDYNLKYSKKGFYWRLKPDSLVVDSIKNLPKNARVLDLGCGEGKDSFFLTKKSFNVTAVDISDEGIKKLKEFAKKEKLKITANVSDIKSYLEDCDRFNAIFGINILKFIDRKNIFSIIKKIKTKTKTKGINVIVSFIARTHKQKEIAFTKREYLFDKGELKKLYKDWKILFYEENYVIGKLMEN